MLNCKWHPYIDLQLFAEGGDGGEGGDAGAESGVTDADPERQRLLELGVPESKIRKKKAIGRSDLPAGAVRTAPVEETPAPTEQAASADAPTTEEPHRMTWDEIMADPEYNKQMQKTVQNRLKSAKSAQDSMDALAPAIELLAQQYGMDPAKLDYNALASAVTGDERYYEEAAVTNGRSVEDEMQMSQLERESRLYRQQREYDMETQRIQQHLDGLERQAETLKQTFPGFDLRKELENPQFARMTSPSGGLSVEDAFYAIHHNEIQAAAAKVAAEKTAEKMANSIRSGLNRPRETGTSSQAPSVASFDYRHASKAQRDALKREINAAYARGEKLYPGGK